MRPPALPPPLSDRNHGPSSEKMVNSLRSERSIRQKGRFSQCEARRTHSFSGRTRGRHNSQAHQEERCRRALGLAGDEVSRVERLVADLDVLAKALEYGGVLATDDYALQNVALHLGLKIEPIGQPRIKRIRKHIQRCRGCGSRFEGIACPDCGTPAPKKKRCI